VPLRLRTELSLLCVAVVLLGCARAAPKLPPVSAYSTVQVPEDERLGKCQLLRSDLWENNDKAGEFEARILGNRKSNQQIGYAASVLFPPLMLAMESNSEEKKHLDQLQVERDVIFADMKKYRCPQ